MMRLKYQILEGQQMRLPDGRALYRIRALKDFGMVKKGEIGGFIESPCNLSHFGAAWVGGDACVYDKARVKKNAYVGSRMRVCGNALITGAVYVTGNAFISGHTKLSGDAYAYISSKAIEGAKL